MISPEFWRGKRVFLTGHTGFKGSWLSLWLLSLGAEVCGYALEPPTEPSLFERLGLEGDMESTLGDVRDLPRLTRALEESRAEIVVHMAAQSLVRQSYAAPVETFSTNVMGTVNLLEAVRLAGGVRAALIVTSDKCYQNNEWVWGYRENEPLGGHDPYSSSKACAELVSGAYLNSFFPPEQLPEHGTAVASARAGNVIGGGDWAKDRLVPDLVRGFASGTPVMIRNPEAIRPWQHVLEPLSGYLMLLERLYGHDQDAVGGWNFGPRAEDAKSVGWLADRLAGLWGEPAGWVLDAGRHPHEAHYLTLDWSKARHGLGWAPAWGIAETLERVAAWYLGFQADRSREAVRGYTLADIEAFMAAPERNEARAWSNGKESMA